MNEELIAILNDFDSIGLSDLDKVQFVNRIDTKFLFPVGRIVELLEIMKGNYTVLEINGNRILGYHTTYFDTVDYLFFNQHVTGRAERSKVRIRYYLSTGSTFLEVKKRTRKNRTLKWRIEHKNSDITLDRNALDFLSGHVPDVAGNLKPVLFNDFNRITFAGINHSERVTIDLDLAFIGTDGGRTDIPYLAIVELKSNGLASRSLFGNLARQLSSHPSGFSKYCLGNAMLFDIPRKNILKQKLLLLNKLENDYKSSRLNA